MVTLEKDSANLPWQSDGNDVTHVLDVSRTVLIVYDNVLAAIGLAALLTEAGGFTVLDPATITSVATGRTLADQPDIAVVVSHSNVPSVRRVLESSTDPVPPIVVVAEPGRAGSPMRPTVQADGLLVVPPDPDVLIPVLRLTGIGYLVFPAQEGGISPAATSGDSPLRTFARRLSRREFEVLNLVARGWTNAEIADIFSMSQRTVKGHVRRILEKLDLPSRTDLIIKAYSSGLIARNTFPAGAGRGDCAGGIVRRGPRRAANPGSRSRPSPPRGP
jgi:DNA-binding NarL/FixJ family response regulator